MSNLFIRNLQASEMYFPVQLASQENWNPGLNDAEYLFRADPEGFWAAFWDEQPAGCISSVSYGKDFGFIGLHIVRPEFRKLSVGKNLLKAALQRLEGRNIGLNCKPEQTGFYEAFGFKASHKIFTFEGISHRDFPPHENVISPFMFPFESLNEFDKKYFPVERKLVLQCWLNQPKSLLLGMVKEKHYLGYGLFKPCEVGYYISPLMSENINIAEELLGSLVSCMETDQPYYMDLPEINDDAIKLAEKMKLKRVNEHVRMYLNGEPDIKLNGIYSFISSVLG